jgi:kinesin family protein 11
MQGDAKDPVNKGIVPRAVETMFKRLERQKKENTIKVSCLQIYNEELQDLLDDESELTAHGGSVSVSKPLKIFEERGGKGGVSIPNLVEEIVTSADDIFKIIEKSNQKRISAATLLNKNSSRSHCIFTVTIHSKEVSVDGEQTIKTGKLNLVDLAGSECVGKSGAMEERAKETGNINKSLLTLGRVINKLVEGQTHIPYRDSKLTRLLQESLGGRAKTVIIATVSPSLICMDETLNTLEYASRAKNILNKPEVNEVKTQKAFVKELNSHILDLQAQLEVARSKNGIYLSEEHFVRMQTDLESQRLLLKEYEQELQSRAKELDQMSELLQQQKTKTEEQYKINEGLRSENASLKKSLDTSIARNGELEYLIQHLRTIETRLNSEAEETRTNLLSSIKECDMLREKITRYEEMDLNNSSRVNATVDEVGKICSNLQSHMIDIGTHFRNTENVLRSKIEGYSESQRAVLQHLKEDLSLVSSSQKELASQISTIIVQHKEATTENDEALSKCLSMQTEKVHESMVASSEHFTSCFERLNGALTKIIENVCLFLNIPM